MVAAMHDPADRLLLLLVTFLLAGQVKGVTGPGLPTVGVGLLSLAMPPAEAASLVVVPSLVTNVWQMGPGAALSPLVRRLWPMLAGVCLGTWAGAGLLTGAGAALPRRHSAAPSFSTRPPACRRCACRGCPPAPSRGLGRWRAPRPASSPPPPACS